MKIVWLAPYPEREIKEELALGDKPANGSGSWMIHLAKALGSIEGIDLHIITYSSHIVRDFSFLKNGISFHIIKYSFPFTRKGASILNYDRFTFYAYLKKKIIALTHEIKPDFVHAHGTESVYSYAASYLSIPNVTSIQGLITEVVKSEPTLTFKLQAKIEKLSIERNLNFGCRTVWDQKLVKEMNNKAKIYYMPEAIDNVFFEIEKKTASTPTITFVGTLVKRKGIELLLETSILLRRKFPDIVINIIGSGDSGYTEKLKSFVEKNQLQNNIQWHGFLSSNKIADILSKSWLLTLPTYIDNSPNCICEAMATGIPVVSVNVGGLSSIVEDGVTGYLLDKHDTTDLFKKISYLILNQDIRDKMGSLAKQTANSRHLPLNTALVTKNVYHQILDIY